MDARPIIKEMLIARRKELGHNWDQASQAIDVSRNTYINWERAITYPSHPALLSLAKYLGYEKPSQLLMAIEASAE